MAYYIRLRGKSFGPFTEEQLQEMKNNGKLGKTSEISENKTDWLSASEIAFLFPTSMLQSASQEGLQTTTGNIATTSLLHSEPAEWFYSINGTEGYGPVTLSAIRQMIQSKSLIAESLVWQQGQNAQEIQYVPTFAGYFNSSSNALVTLQPQTDLRQNNASSYNANSQNVTSYNANQFNVSSFCVACGKPVVQTAQICPQCGSPINRIKPKSRITYILLAIFLSVLWGRIIFMPEEQVLLLFNFYLD
jgi:hypothetical protein